MFFASTAGIPPVASITALLLWAAPPVHAADVLMDREPQATINKHPAQRSQQGVIAVERERLVLIGNQLAHIGQQVDAIGDIVRSYPPQNARYHFDYAQMKADIARVKAGIDAYLNPSRTQPRDVGELPAYYTREAREDETQ